MNVQITNKKSGRQVAIYPINLGGDIGNLEKDFFEEAWRCAVEDGAVEANDRETYAFKLLAD